MSSDQQEQSCCDKTLDAICCGSHVSEKLKCCLTCSYCFKRNKEDEYDSEEEKGEEDSKPVDLRKDSKSAPKDLCRIKKKGRRLRDCPVLVIFFLFLLGMGYITFHAFYYGDPSRLYYPTDYMGRVCGKDNSGMPKNFLELPFDINCKNAQANSKNTTAAALCEAAVAPHKIDLTGSRYLWFMSIFDPINYGGVCVSYCPSTRAEIRHCPPELNQNVTDTFFFGQLGGRPYCSVDRVDNSITSFPTLAEENYVQSYLKYTSVLNRCFLSVVGTNSSMKANSTIAQALGTATGVASNLWGDVMRSWKVLILGSLFALFISFVFLVFVRCFTGIVVWSTIIITFLGIAGLGAFMVYEGYSKKVELDAKQLSTVIAQIVFYVGIFFLVLAAGYAGLALFFICRIRKAIGIIEEAAKALSAMPQIIFFPVILGILYMLFLTYWIFVAVFLWAAGTPTIDGYTVRYTLDYISQGIFAYHVFGLLWITNFFLAFEFVVVAGAIGSWYWRRDKRFSLNEPVLKAVGRTLVYHMGSIAMGSLIVAVIQFIRIIFEKAQRELTNRLNNDKIVKGCVWYVRGFLFVFETVVKYINKHAYIQIALYGNNFFVAARNAFLIISRNILQLGTLDVLTWIVLMVGRVAISVLSALFAYGLTKVPVLVDDFDYSSSAFMVAFLVFIIALAISSLFMTILSCAVDTILQCFLVDYEICSEDTSAKPYCTSSLSLFIKEAQLQATCADKFNCHLCICLTCDCCVGGQNKGVSDLANQPVASKETPSVN